MGCYDWDVDVGFMLIREVVIWDLWEVRFNVIRIYGCVVGWMGLGFYLDGV